MIIITGASKGIGNYLFEKMSQNFPEVIGTYNSTNYNNKAAMYKVDVSDYNSVDLFYNSIKDSAKNIILINCAGITYSSFTHKSSPDLWKKVIDVNLIGTYHVIRAFLPLMREQNYGRIINFSSVLSSYPTPGVSAYAASKSGLIGLTKSLAVENGSKGISINAINLGYFSLGMSENDVPEDYKAKILERIPMKRFGKPEEIFTTICYLINTEYINGSIIDISGGLI